MAHRNPYVHRSCIASDCEACNATGRVTHPVTGCDVRCSDCDGYGETYRSEFAPRIEEAGQPAPSPLANSFSPVESVNTTANSFSPKGQPITFGGHQLDAPGFTRSQFERAIVRALVDQLEIHEVNGRHIVSHPGLTSGYHATRSSCTCKAGAVGTPCKHRAALIFHLDVREPAVRRQWQALDRKAAA